MGAEWCGQRPCNPPEEDTQPPLCPALLEDAERESIIAQNSSYGRENEI